jgi:hypothetical protein
MTYNYLPTYHFKLEWSQNGFHSEISLRFNVIHLLNLLEKLPTEDAYITYSVAVQDKNYFISQFTLDETKFEALPLVSQ